jgi:isochorismate synthase
MSLEIAVSDPARLSSTLVEKLAGTDIYALAGHSVGLPQVGWADSVTGERWLGLGAAECLETDDPAEVWDLTERIRDRLRQQKVSIGDRALPRFFGGIAFDASAGPHPEWPAGIAARFVLPRILACQTRDSKPARVAILGDPEEAVAILRGIRLTHDEPREAFGVRLRRVEARGERPAWESAVREAIRRIDPHTVRKIVLSRDIRYEAPAPIDPWSLFSRIAGNAPHGVQFSFTFDGDGTLLGATPERLVRLDGRRVACDCLAGTIARGKDEAEDLAFAEILLASEKDRREHRLVLDGILEALAPLTLWRESPASPFVLRLPRVQHLSTPVRAWLNEDVRLRDLLSALHPTPAVGGSPKGPAMAAIRELESRPRGWYAGPVGWIGTDSADLAVGIRSAIVRGSTVTVIGGAGIVQGSDPHAEWEETARKAASLLSLFAETEG